MSDARKMERIQKRALRYVLTDFKSSYKDLLHMAGKPSLYAARQRSMLESVFKIIMRSNTVLVQPAFQTVRYGFKSLRCQGPMQWNKLPSDFKNKGTLHDIKRCVTDWPPCCNCGTCILCTI